MSDHDVFARMLLAYTNETEVVSAATLDAIDAGASVHPSSPSTPSTALDHDHALALACGFDDGVPADFAGVDFAGVDWNPALVAAPSPPSLAGPSALSGGALEWDGEGEQEAGPSNATAGPSNAGARPCARCKTSKVKVSVPLV